MPILNRQTQRIYYEFHSKSRDPGGDSTILVLIHGLGLDTNSWNWLIPLFPPEYGVLCYDLRGHGRSTGAANLNSVQDLCDDLAELMDSLKLNQVHLVGHGIGGTTAIWFARAFPARVETITLISTQLLYPPRLIEQMNLHRRSLTLGGNIEPIANHIIERICQSANQLDPNALSIRKILKDAFLKMTLASYFRYFQLPPEDVNLLPSLPAIQTPVLHIAGEYDRVNPPYFYGFGSSWFPSSRFVIIPRASNAVQIDDPQTTVSLIQEHIHSYHLMTPKQPDYGDILRDGILAGLDVDELHLHALQVSVLQGFHVYHRNREIHGEWNRRKAKELLLYLVFNPVSTREDLALALWPNARAEQARNRLRGALHHLKSIFAGVGCLALTERLETTVDSVKLNGAVECDLIHLAERLMDIADEASMEHKMMECHEVLDDPRLTQLDSLSYEWILDFRDRIETQISDLAEWLANLYYEAGQQTKSLHYYLIAAKLWTPNETVYDRIIEIYTLANDKLRARIWQEKRLEIF